MQHYDTQDVDDQITVSNIDCKNLVKDLALEHFDVVKKSVNCVVFRSGSFFYKCRKLDKRDIRNTFNIMIWRAFTNEYKALGLKWDFFTISNELGFYAIEKRQRLELVDIKSWSKNEVLVGAAVVCNKVQKTLEFPRMTAQIREHPFLSSEIDKLVLFRDCIFDYNDFALHNDTIVALGNSAYGIALLKEGKVIKDIKSQAVKLNLSFGNFWFSRYRKTLFDYAPLENILGLTDKWWIYSADECKFPNMQEFYINERDKMFQANFKILTTKKNIPVKLGADYAEFDRLSIEDESQVLSQIQRFSDAKE